MQRKYSHSANKNTLLLLENTKIVQDIPIAYTTKSNWYK